jgi:hypothetical protein
MGEKSWGPADRFNAVVIQRCSAARSVRVDSDETSAERQAAIDNQIVPGNVVGIVGGKEQRRLADAVGFGEIAERHRLNEFVGALADRLSGAATHLAIVESRRHTIGADAVAAILPGQTACQPEQRALAGNVVGIAAADEGRDRGNVDNAALLLFAHHAKHRLAADEHAGEIDLDRALPGFELDL